MIRHPDIVAATFLIVLGAAMFFFAAEIKVTAGVATFSARFFPQLAAGGIVLCGIAMLAKALLADRQPLPFLFNTASLSVAVLFCLYFPFFEHVDFRLGSWALMLGCMWVLGARSVWQLVLTPIITALAIFWVFTLGFEVVLPRWI